MIALVLYRYDVVTPQSTKIGGLNVELHQIWVNAREPGSAPDGPETDDDDDFRKHTASPAAELDFGASPTTHRGLRRTAKRSQSPHHPSTRRHAPESVWSVVDSDFKLGIVITAEVNSARASLPHGTRLDVPYDQQLVTSPSGLPLGTSAAHKAMMFGDAGVCITCLLSCIATCGFF